MDGVLIREEIWTQKHREDGHMKTEIETGVMLLQGKDCWEPLEDGKRQGEVLS